MNYLGAEISLLLEDLDIPTLRLQHFAGKFNRPHERGDMPGTLRGVKLVKLKAGSLNDFSLPSPGAPESVGRTKWQGTRCGISCTEVKRGEKTMLSGGLVAS